MSKKTSKNPPTKPKHQAALDIQIPPMTLENETFTDQTIRLDNIHYKKCTFTDCSIIYGGNGPFHLTECSLRGVQFSLDQQASRTMTFLSYIYSISPDIFESYINTMKSGSLLEKAGGPNGNA